jgi:hypothetical protein
MDFSEFVVSSAVVQSFRFKSRFPFLENPLSHSPTVALDASRYVNYIQQTFRITYVRIERKAGLINALIACGAPAPAQRSTTQQPPPPPPTQTLQSAPSTHHHIKIFSQPSPITNFVATTLLQTSSNTPLHPPPRI